MSRPKQVVLRYCRYATCSFNSSDEQATLKYQLMSSFTARVRNTRAPVRLRTNGTTTWASCMCHPRWGRDSNLGPLFPGRNYREPGHAHCRMTGVAVDEILANRRRTRPAQMALRADHRL